MIMLIHSLFRHKQPRSFCELFTRLREKVAQLVCPM